MSDAWKVLRKRNQRENEIRERETRAHHLLAVHILPMLPALFFMVGSDGSRQKIFQRVTVLDRINEVVGPFVVTYMVVIAYWMLIGLLLAGLHKFQKSAVTILITWLAWTWFYYGLWYLDDMGTAFAGLFVVALFSAKVIGWISICYDKIREGMFFSRSDDT